MRRPLTVGLVLLVLTTAACATSRHRDFTRYYDPNGLFTAILPGGNELQTPQPQQAQSGPSLVSGVIATPPQPSPSPQDQLGAFGGFAQETASPDQTIYQVLVVTTDSFADLDAMALYFLTGDPSIDVRVERDDTFGGSPGRLVVAEVRRQGQPTAGVAAELSLGRQGVGYLLVAVFPPGDWGKEESDFLEVAHEFRPGVPPTLETFPLAGTAS